MSSHLLKNFAALSAITLPALIVLASSNLVNQTPTNPTSTFAATNTETTRIRSTFITNSAYITHSQECNFIFGSVYTNTTGCDPISQGLNLRPYLPNNTSSVLSYDGTPFLLNGQNKLLQTFLLNDLKSVIKRVCDYSTANNTIVASNCTPWETEDLALKNIGTDRFLSASQFVYMGAGQQKIAHILYGSDAETAYLNHCNFTPSNSVSTLSSNCLPNWTPVNLSKLRSVGEEKYRSQANFVYQVGDKTKLNQTFLDENGLDSYVRDCDLNPASPILDAINCNYLGYQKIDLRPLGIGPQLSISKFSYPGTSNKNNSNPNAFVKAETNYFTQNGQRFFPYGSMYTTAGVNMPSYQVRPGPGETSSSFFGSPHYETLSPLIDKELADLASLGYNTISIGSYFEGTKNGSTNLSNFLSKAKNHGLKVNIFIPYCDPMTTPNGVGSYNLDKCLNMIRSLNFMNRPELFSYEIIWEGNIVFFDSPTYSLHLAPKWEEWLTLNYGSLQNAKTNWGYSDTSIPTRDQINIDSQTYRPKVNAFRRFIADYAGIEVAKVVSEIKKIDPNHLISGRSYGFDGDLEYIASVSRFLDYISWEAYQNSLPINNEDTLDFAKINNLGPELISYMTGYKKPIIIQEFGYGILSDRCLMEVNKDDPKCYNETNPEKIRQQAIFFQKMYDLIENGNIAGVQFWEYVDKRPTYFTPGTDFQNTIHGIRNLPETINGNLGKTHPSYYVVKSNSTRFPQTLKSYSGKLKGLDLDNYINSLQLLKAYAPQYKNLVDQGQYPQVVSTGDGTNSTNVPNKCVGNTSPNTQCAHKYLNSQFTKIQIKNRDGNWQDVNEGDTVIVAPNTPVLARIDAINIGDTTWVNNGSRGSISVGSGETNSTLNFRLPITSTISPNNTLSISDIIISNGINTPQTVALRMVSESVSWFGQRISVKITPPGNFSPQLAPSISCPTLTYAGCSTTYANTSLVNVTNTQATNFRIIEFESNNTIRNNNEITLPGKVLNIGTSRPTQISVVALSTPGQSVNPTDCPKFNVPQCATGSSNPPADPIGWIDQANCNTVSGWSCDPAYPSSTATVTLFANGSQVATTNANINRVDLASACDGNSAHAFSFPVQPYMKTGTNQSLTATATIDGVTKTLSGNPSINCAPETPTCTTLTQSPTNLAPSGTLNTTNQTLTWNLVTGATGYWVYIDDTSNPDSTTSSAGCQNPNPGDYCTWPNSVLSTNSLNYTFEAGKTYTWRVAAVGGCTGGSPASPRKSITIASLPTSAPICNPPTQPTGLSVQCASSGKTATIRWNNALNASKYPVRVDDQDDSVYTVSEITTGRSNECPSANHDLCLDWQTNSIGINIQPNRTYKTWVHSQNSCSYTAETSTTFSCPSSSSGSSTITVYAAGTPAFGEYPQMEIRINSQPMRQWTVNADTQAYTYTHPTRVTPDQLRIQFPNDAASEDWSEDRNLFVDAVVIDGARYETESPDTYSSGTYEEGTGCAGGNKQSEWLHCFGFFQYGGTPATTLIAPTATTKPAPTTAPSTGASTTVNFNNRTTDAVLNGQYPTNVINWGTNSRWFVTSPWGDFTTNSLSFNGADISSASFTLTTPQRLTQLKITNGGNDSTGVIITCGSQSANSNLSAGQTKTFNTGFASPCSSITISSTNGWDTAFDDLVITN